MNSNQFLELVDGVYASALEPDRWPTALHRIAGAIGAVGADVYLLRDDELLFASIGGVPDAELGAYLERFHGRTRRYHAVARLPENGIVTDADFISEREMRSTPFYEGFLRPLDVYHSISAVTLRRGDDLGLLGVQLSLRQGPPTDQQHQLVETLIPHVRRASQVHLRLIGADLRERRLAECIDRLQVGLVLIDQRGRIQLANLAAQEFLRQERGLIVDKRRLLCRNSTKNRALQRAVAAALGEADNPEEVVLVDGAAAQAPLTVWVCGVPRARREAEGVGGMIFISDPDAVAAQSTAGMLRAAFGLTPAEAGIAAALADGFTLRTIARQRRISFETARTHLKRIFDKTGVRNQAGLVRLILRTFGSIR
jgi:DNA-binding CsgD family transcriptional regulator